MRLPDLMTIPSSRALAYVLLLGIGASFLGLLIPTILGGRGSELGVPGTESQRTGIGHTLYLRAGIG